ncbi:aminoacyl-histidine dipeptidase [Maribacter sp. 2210JD10-5]|uniref:aminoacyl-histidine dipeptidase n=1 Tax=Maribacter sp. 2210JD10-5 TaxID=3386272 RepID=UPI0039BCE645
MNEAIKDLDPKPVWKNFANLNAVPRPSKKEERVIAFMVEFGNSLGLETFTDDIGNVVIRKPASVGMEAKKMVTLQSHLDMVHQKNNDTAFDFETQGIQMYVDGDWVKAKGTTLGADNGMGVAAIMALLESKDIVHPPLEALFTIDEETGMTGAFGLKGGILQGNILLNLDTEEDDEIGIGCAGGIDVNVLGRYQKEPCPIDSIAYKIEVKGLKGGHSGMDIHKGLGNANKIMNRVIHQLNIDNGALIAMIDGGSLRNAIPRESTAVVVVDKGNDRTVTENFQKIAKIIKAELSLTEPTLEITMARTETPGFVIGEKESHNLIRSLYGAHNGVYAMSASIPNLVETSNNIARVKVDNGTIAIGCLTRSSVETAKMDLAFALKAVFELANYQVSFDGAYPGWNPNPNSEIVSITKNCYTKLFKQEPIVAACHAGLECGILGQNYPDMDMVSFGPTIRGAHSPDERVSISSVQKFWDFLIRILKETP